MSIRKLSAGSGYDYLTRQVAALDATQKGHVGLASYYTERGETPGVWVGAGLVGVDGLDAGDVVTAEQMRLLFGEGRHPVAGVLGEPAPSLGQPFSLPAAEASPFQRELAARFAAVNVAAGRPPGSPIPADVRARLRSEVATQFFRSEFGRNPSDARELSGMLARLSRPRSTTVAGYDLTFSPVKSVSALWAVADPATAAVVEKAHHAAVAEALRFLETHALFTREGRAGVRQVNVHGFVAAAFTHRDSRAGDPDLHTHVAVANKVQTLAGKWLSVDGRLLFQAKVTASETYNTALEAHLSNRLGLRFAERPNRDTRKRGVREIVGVDPALNERWSSRRQAIVVRQGELASRFQSDHGRPPTPVEALQLAQQATLETRDAKHEPRTLTEQRATWHSEAVQTLGGERQLDAMLDTVLHPHQQPATTITADWVTRTAAQVVATVEEHRSTWQTWHLRAEALRQVRSYALPPGQVEPAVDQLVDHALQACVPLTPPGDGLVEPGPLLRADGSSVYTVAGADQYTSQRILDAEERLVAAAGLTDGRVADSVTVELALLESAANGVPLDAGQAAMVRAMATSGLRLQLAVAPAGAGKTTALHTLTRAWTDAGGTVIGLAPSAVTAAQLAEHTGAPADTLAKLTWALNHHQPLPAWADTAGPGTLVLVDEAGMADTITLDTAVAFILRRGGSVRLVGDDAQLGAIGAGGVLADLQAVPGTVRLTEVHRFADPTEAAATLALRDGHTEALGFYLDRHRIHVGDPTTITDQLFTAWRHDRDQGLDALMLAPTRDQVAHLNHQARHRRLHGLAPGREVDLADGNRASAGDTVITRRNHRQLTTSSGDWVRNGDRWRVLNLTASGGLRVRHVRTGRTATLPTGFVRESVDLGYASTIHAAQGVTADTVHGLITSEASRQQLYTMLTRGRTTNHVYLAVVSDGDPHTAIHPDTLNPSTGTELLEQILARDDTPTSAAALHRTLDDPAQRLGTAADRYIDALHAAAQDVAGPEVVGALERTAEHAVPGLTQEPAWPTLRAHLLLRGAAGANARLVLTAAAATRQVDTATDRAAVIHARISEIALSSRGPLPWLPDIPAALADDPRWGNYLMGRAQLIDDLARQVRLDAAGRFAGDRRPAWAADIPQPPVELTGDVELWRAATHVDTDDPRPTGPTASDGRARAWQRQLDERLGVAGPQDQPLMLRIITQLAPGTGRDSYTPTLARRLALLADVGYDSRTLLHQAVAAGPLPDDHPAAALWWRITENLRPKAAAPAQASNSPRQSRAGGRKHPIPAPLPGLQAQRRETAPER